MKNPEVIKDFLNENDRFARYCGASLTAVTEGCAEAQMTVQPHHMNGAQRLQGGAVFTLADFAFAAAANSREKVALTLSATITFHKAVCVGETITAIASEIACGKTIATYQVNIVNEKQERIASYSGTAYRKDLPVVE